MTPTELSELFERDPLKHSEQDTLEIIKRLREQRSNFEIGLKTAPKAAKPAKESKAGQMLKDLGLG